MDYGYGYRQYLTLDTALRKRRQPAIEKADKTASDDEPAAGKK